MKNLKNNKLKFLFLLTTLTVLLIIQGCGNSGQIIFNPTEDVLTVNIDENEYNIAPNDIVEVEITEGIHKVSSHISDITVMESQDIDFTSSFLSSEGIVNASGQSLYLFSEYYAENADLGNDLGFLVNFRQLEINGVKMFADVKEYDKNTILVEKTWDLGIQEQFLEEVDIYDNTTQKIVRKIFSQDELVNYWNVTYAKDFEGFFDDEMELDIDELEEIEEELMEEI